MRKAIGVDLGGSHTTAAVVQEDGKIGSQHELDIEDRTFDAVIDAVECVVKDAVKAAKGDDLAGLGVGSPGNIDLETGVVRYSPNFQWNDVPLGPRLRERFPSLPVYVANDARCATLGEYTFGSGRDTKNFVLLTLGTGIGGGIVSEGQLLIGNMAGAGEIGHHQIRPADGFICACGKIGCFEAQASGTGLIRHAFAIAPSFPRSMLLQKSPEKLGSKAIRKAAQAGDQHAAAAWNRYVNDLALGLANIIAFVNPEVIALGGGVSSAGDFMTEGVLPIVDSLTTMVPKHTTRIVTATLGNDAGQVGAATVAFRGGLHPAK
ncbi:MAG: ROK family protein [Candidatus Eremiobacteraeota bacterium]|nr:ROK family protein [Candidatus Eremiobacteraeota bacterium]